MATFKKQSSDAVIAQRSRLELFNKSAYKKVPRSNFINNVFCIWLETFGWQLFFQGVVEQSSNPIRFPHWSQAVHHGC